MKVLVTGSSGLIGQWVCRQLEESGLSPEGLDIVPPLPQQGALPYRQCDILDTVSLAKVFNNVRPAAVIHLAARTDLDETQNLDGYQSNIEGVRNVLTCVKDCPSVKRIIVTSSQLVCRVGCLPRDDHDYCPGNLYGQSKVLTEQVTRKMDGGGKEWCLVRPTTVWGPGMSPHYQRMIRYIQEGKYFHCGRGKLYKSYSYAGNIAFQYLRFLLAPAAAIQGQVFYLADYQPLSLREYAEQLARALDAPPIRTLPLPVARGLAEIGEILNRIGFKCFPFNRFRLQNILTEYCFDLSKTREVCGPLPYSFEQGIQATIEWYRKQNA